MSVELEEFGKIVVEYIRDSSIRSCRARLRQNTNHVIVGRWREAAAQTPESFASVLIPDIVDNTIFYLLEAINQGLLPLSFTASNGATISLNDGRGELAGFYAGDFDSWRHKFSKEVVIDNFPDLK